MSKEPESLVSVKTVLTAVAIAIPVIAGYVNLKMQVATIQTILSQVVDDTENDLRQDETLSKHWKIASWSKDMINTLRVKHDMPVTGWPDLD